MSDSCTFTFDTNILFYASDSMAGDKHIRALSMTDAALGQNCILTLQALGELANSMIKRRAVSAAAAHQIVRAYRNSFPVIATTEADLDSAFSVHQQNSIPFWDAMLWATARRAGCTLLLTEDFHDGQVLGGVTIRNPFKMQPDALTALLK